MASGRRRHCSNGLPPNGCTHTNRGVFVTTGRFTQGAWQFAESVAMQLVLIDGVELTRLMVEYNIGVSVRETFELNEGRRACRL
jgi:restriction endonuclease Mrr